jgi:arylsulfatase A-like enzyme
LSQRTVVIVTADHGGQRNDYYLGNNQYQSCCAFERRTAPFQAPYWLAHLTQLGKLKTGYVDTSITLWLADRSAANEAAITRGLIDVSGVTEVYALRVSGESHSYERTFSRLETQSAAFQSWARRHSAELVATMAGPSAPDLVALLGDGFGFGRIGGHGGAQERVQRIPMFIRVPGESPSSRREALRLMDIAPETAGILGLPTTATR